MEAEVLQARKKALSVFIAFFIEKVQEEEHIAFQVDVAEAAENITTLFARYFDELVAPTEVANIQIDKIVAVIELATRRVGPLSAEGLDDETKDAYNARLAVHCAIGFLLEAKQIDPLKFSRLIERDQELRGFLAEHINWLSRLQIRYLSQPFTAAQVWRLFELVVSDRI